MGPLALTCAVLLHVPVPTRQNALPPQPDKRTERPDAVPTDQRLLTTWQDNGCLYPVKPVDSSGRTTTVRFGFGEEAERDLADLFISTDLRREIGVNVWVELPSGDAWAPGNVRDTRTDHLLIEFDPDASCASGFRRPREWLPTADILAVQPMENLK